MFLFTLPVNMLPFLKEIAVNLAPFSKGTVSGEMKP